VAKQKWRVLVGMNYPPNGRAGTERRVEPGEVVDDLPAAAVAGLAEQGVIEPAEPAEPKE
jgi:hypothetical protein